MEPFTMAAIYLGIHILRAVVGKLDQIIETAILTWNAVRDWLTARKLETGDVGQLVNQRLANGGYRVVCGIFSKTGQMREQVAWDCNEMDYEMRQKLAGRHEIKIEI